jgi:hypothetical protein
MHGQQNIKKEVTFVAHGYSSGIWVHISRTAYVKVTLLKVPVNAADHLLDAVLFFPGRLRKRMLKSIGSCLRNVLLRH